MARQLNGIIQESYAGELDNFLELSEKLIELFPEVEWDIDFEAGNISKFIIVCHDYDFYFNNKKLKTWRGVLKKKFPKLAYFMCYRAKLSVKQKLGISDKEGLTLFD